MVAPSPHGRTACSDDHVRMQLLANLKPVPKNDGGKRQRSEIVASRVQAPGQGRSTVSRSGPALAAAWLQHVVASTGEDVAGVAGDRCGDDIDDDLAGAEHRVGQRLDGERRAERVQDSGFHEYLTATEARADWAGVRTRDSTT